MHEIDAQLSFLQKLYATDYRPIIGRNKGQPKQPAEAGSGFWRSSLN